ncbi:MAG: tetratricopeptide repeat protein [Chloroflexota bacterium]|nr:tetratricopeptide repeat protein [Chloroflexota bacterium]
MTDGTTGTRFGVWLKQRRKEQGIGPDQFAELVGCSSITLLKIEAGERRPSRQLAELLAAQLHIATDEIEPFIAFARIGHAAMLDTTSEAAARAPWRSAHSRLTNLPSVLTSFVGREEDVDKALSLLLQPKVRLLTLTGAPGIGKTRLALQVASNLAGNFEDGVFLVELAPIRDPDLLSATVARTLGLKEEATQTVEDLLLKHLSDRRMLLVLDNFEQLLDAAPAVVRLLEASPWLKVLVTSREVLHVRGERRLPVPPLSTPERGHLPRIEALAQYSSVALFIERAGTVSPGFTLTEANAADVAAICIGLEGLPLALELAAARLEQFAPGVMRAALGNRLSLLTGGERDLPFRQRTLRSAIEWSYELLSANEQRLVRLLGIFVGGFTLEAAAALYGEPTRDVQERLAVLVDKNLIRMDLRLGETRYGMLEVIREFALEDLVVRGQEEETRQRHALYFLQFVQRAANHFAGPEQVEWLDEVEREYNNISEALEWLLRGRHGKSERERLEMAAHFCSALFLFWEKHGHPGDARAWFKLAAQRITNLVEEDAKTHVGAGAEVPATGNASYGSYATHVALALAPDLPVLWARMLSGAGVTAYYQGDYEEARALHEEGLALRRGMNDRTGIAASLNNLGNVASEQGDLEAARFYHAESLLIAREINDEWKIGMSLNNLGIVEMNLGNLVEARALFDESLALARESEDAGSIARTLNNLGIVTRYGKEYTQARAFCEEALVLDRQMGENRGVALTLVNMGFVARDNAEHAQARDLFLEGLQLVSEVGDKRVTAECLEGLASVAVATGSDKDAELAVKLYGAGSAIRRNINAPLAPVEQISYDEALRLARERVGEVVGRAAWEEGQALSIEAAIALAQGA